MRRPLNIPAALGLCGTSLLAYGVVVGLNWPGHFSPDGLWQLGQGRTGVFNTWHPPVMAWLLGLAARLSPNVGAFMSANAALFFGALLGFATTRPRPRPRAILAVLGLTALPVVLVLQGAVLKDILFANATLVGFACLAWRDRLSPGGWRLRLSLVAAALCFTLAALTRQIGLVAPLCGGLCLIAILRSEGASRARAMRGGGLFLAVVMALSAGASLFFISHSDGRPETLLQLRRLQAWDMAGALHLDPALALPATHASAPDLEAYLRAQAAPRWRAGDSDPVAHPPSFQPLMSSRAEGVGLDWRRLILTRPGLYLRLRSQVFWATLATPRSENCPMVIIGVDGSDAPALKASGLRPRRTATDEALEDYASDDFGGPVFSHLAWGLALVAGMALALRDWRGGDHGSDLAAVIALALAALLYTAGFFVISGACDYRYLYLVDAAAMALLVHRAARRPGTPPGTLRT